MRAKRANQTIFLNTEPTDTISDVKLKISSINKVPAENIRVIWNNSPQDEAKALSDVKIENDAIVYFVYKKEGKLRSRIQTKNVH